MTMSDRQSAQTQVNADQVAGAHRIRYADLFDAEVRLHNERFRAVAGVGPGDRVLDIGCGAGQSTREAARAAVAGSALGVDLSEPMLELARRLSTARDCATSPTSRPTPRSIASRRRTSTCVSAVSE
jgi:cyclopropane fatty-acyl-phospholipid synthase-like methyltransferase